MYRVLVKPHMLRPIASETSQLMRASVHGQTHSKIPPSEDFYVSTSSPDDFDTSPLSSQILQQQMQDSGSDGSFAKLTKEEHYAIIYESINPKAPKGNAKKEDPIKLNMEEEPHIDDM